MVSVHPRQLCSMVIVVLQNNRYHHESYRIINTGNFIFTSTSFLLWFHQPGPRYIEYNKANEELEPEVVPESY